MGFLGHSGNLLDGIGLHCAAPAAWMHSAQVQSSVAQVGSHSGNAFSDVCSRQEVVTYLIVRTGNNVDRQQAYCSRMRHTLPTNCRGIKTLTPSATDGEYTLYLGGDPNKPWQAWCHDMAGTPAEYLSLPATGDAVNFSQYTAGLKNGVGSTNVRTRFTRLRIDPATLSVSTGDQRFSTSSGQLNHDGPVTSMSYAASMSCDLLSSGMGNIDLRDTPFAVAAQQFAVAGSSGSGQATYSANNQVVDLGNKGNCAWNSVVGADRPFNGRDFALQLEYLPPPPPPPFSGSFTYEASETYNGAYRFTPFDVRLKAGQQLQYGTCGVAGSSGSGNSDLSLHAPDGSPVSGANRSCGSLVYGAHTATQTGTYQIRAGCRDRDSCSGTVAFAIQ